MVRWGPVRSGPVGLSQTSPIPRSPDGDNKQIMASSIQLQSTNQTSTSKSQQIRSKIIVIIINIVIIVIMTSAGYRKQQTGTSPSFTANSSPAYYDRHQNLQSQ